MKKTLVAVTAALLSVTAFAQSAPPANANVRALFEQLRATHELVKQDKAALESALQAKQPTAITAARAKLETDRAAMRKIHEELKAEGVAPRGHGGPGGPEGHGGPGQGHPDEAASE